MTITTPEPADDPLRPLVLGWIATKGSVNTRQAYGRDIAEWLEWCASRGTWAPDAAEIDYALWARHLEASGCTASTAARKLSVVSSWYKWLVRNGHAEKNPADHVDRPAVDRQTSMTPGLTRQQSLALLAAADSARGPQQLRTSALVATLLFSGARLSEATAADIEDLGMSEGYRVLWVTRKGGKRQGLVLTGAVTTRIDAYLASRGDVESRPAVPGEPGAPKPRRVLFAADTGARLNRRDMWHLIRRLGKTAGLPPELVSHIGPHALRHTAITIALRKGIPLHDVQDMAGHASADTTQRYNHARHRLDRSPAFAIAAYLASDEDGA
jgi:integrase/recombinase XerD